MTGFDPFVAQGAIDLTAFLGQWPWRLQAATTTSTLRTTADRLGLTGFCVSHIASIFGFDTRSGNENLLESCAEDSRLWPFVVINPTEDAWEHELDWARNNGARGVRLVPSYHGYRLNQPELTEFAAAIAESGLPLSVCATLEDDRLRHPRFQAWTSTTSEIAELLRHCADISVVLSGVRLPEWTEIQSHLGSDHPIDRVLIDLWFTNGPTGIIAALCREGHELRFGFGSCAPIQSIDATAYQLATADITDEQRTTLCRGNAERILK